MNRPPENTQNKNGGAPALSVSVVIPVLNAESYLDRLIPAIQNQQPAPPAEIILVDSMSSDHTREKALTYEGVRVVPIENFSHGRGRNMGVQAASGGIIALLTQDALPADEHWLAELLKPFSDPQVAAAYSRQTPYPNATPMERFFLETHFPARSGRQCVEPGKTDLAFQQDVFFSNVSGAIRRDLLLKHPFDEKLIMSEDQQFARDVLLDGYSIAYQATSVVQHSHNYSLRTVFKRYFDSVYSLTQLFTGHDMGKSASMGLNYLFREARFMLTHHPLWLPYYFCYTLAKTTGTIAGHYADRMPRWLLRRLSMHSYHWREKMSENSENMVKKGEKADF